METAFQLFNQAYPSYRTTESLDALRREEYSRLDESGHVYLDYTGGGLYAQSQLRKQMELLEKSIFGNPHSENPTSLAMTRQIDQVRSHLLRYFNASPDEYSVVFTPNATGALKLIGESYPFTPGSRYMLTTDCHNSVNGIMEFALAKGATLAYVPVEPPELLVDEGRLSHGLGQAVQGVHNLFAYPAQSNFSGVQHPLDWISQAKDRGWDILLDCAAFVPTNHLDLSRWHPDFAVLSFYKIFGYPTGIGCLMARKSALFNLRRPWFSGGTVSVVSVKCERCHFLSNSEAAFEDGTVNYLNLPAIGIGLNHITEVGIDKIHERVRCLTGWLLDQMQEAHHSNGRALVKIYGPLGLGKRGGTIAFNLLDANGKMLKAASVQRLSNEANISLRTGCFCNPGSAEAVHNLTEEELRECFLSKGLLSERSCFIHKQAESVCKQMAERNASVRVSLGLVTNFEDVYRFMQFIISFRDKVEGDLEIHL
jgi:molybdenum cofactor sulfurtransferase